MRIIYAVPTGKAGTFVGSSVTGAVQLLPVETTLCPVPYEKKKFQTKKIWLYAFTIPQVCVRIVEKN